jgi:hypothetical protein
MDGILKMHLMGGTWQSLVSLEIYGESVCCTCTTTATDLPTAGWNAHVQGGGFDDAVQQTRPLAYLLDTIYHVLTWRWRWAAVIIDPFDPSEPAYGHSCTS